jgi:hypothetical protein
MGGLAARCRACDFIGEIPGIDITHRLRTRRPILDDRTPARIADERELGWGGMRAAFATTGNVNVRKT